MSFCSCSFTSAYKFYHTKSDYDRMNAELNGREGNIILKNGDVIILPDIHIEPDSTSWPEKPESLKKIIIKDKGVNTLLDDTDLIVLTRDSTCYFFETNTSRFLKDSLDGLAAIYGVEKKERIKISLTDIVATLDETTDCSLDALQAPIKKSSIFTSETERLVLTNRGNGASAGAGYGFLTGINR